MTYDEFLGCFNGGKKAMLFYSGGKDSLACLCLLKPVWDQVDVVWVNTGAPYPEIVKHMEKVRKLVPRFTELKGNVLDFYQKFGTPVDVIPFAYTALGQEKLGPKPTKFCATFECCAANMWVPMNQYLQASKPDYLVKGDRSKERTDPHKEYIGSTQLLTPVWDYTDDQIIATIKSTLPDLLEDRHYMPFLSSLDCLTCMGYSKGHKGRMAYLKTHHPLIYERKKRCEELLAAAVTEQMNLYRSEK